MQCAHYADRYTNDLMLECHKAQQTQVEKNLTYPKARLFYRELSTESRASEALVINCVEKKQIHQS